MMRVVGGRCRGRRLASFRGLSIRPTSDRVREAIFNILKHTISEETRVLDLFAGTGAMGIEALSRGAGKAVFVDKGSTAVSLIRKNLKICGLEERARVIKRDAVSAIDLLSGRRETFNLVFIDPPYRTDLAEKTLRALSGHTVVEPDGMVVVELPRKSQKDLHPEGFSLVDERTYGDTAVYFFEAR